MKYEDFEVVAALMKRLEQLTQFENAVQNKHFEFAGIHLSFVGVNTSTGLHFAKYSKEQAKKVDPRIITCDHDFHSMLAYHIETYKKEICTALHDLGVDTTKLQKDLKL